MRRMAPPPYLLWMLWPRGRAWKFWLRRSKWRQSYPNVAGCISRLCNFFTTRIEIYDVAITLFCWREWGCYYCQIFYCCDIWSICLYCFLHVRQETAESSLRTNITYIILILGWGCIGT